MKFNIHRISGKEPPCEGAVKETRTYIDRRNVDSPVKLSPHNRDHNRWYEQGTNHRVVDGCIERDMPEEVWTIEISDLEGMVALTDEVGEVIIVPQGNGQLPVLEIYDDYRE